jgi:hypothetical protein
VLKEMVGLGVRSFLNHTPAVPESGKAAALLSGKQRFGRYLDLVAANVRGGDSVLGDVTSPEPPAAAGDEVDQGAGTPSEPSTDPDAAAATAVRQPRPTTTGAHP